MRSITLAAAVALAAGLAPHLGHAAVNDVDQDFATRATQANIAEIQEAQRADTRAGSKAVKTFAQRMIKDHSESLKALRDVTSGRTDLGQPAKPNAQQVAEQGHMRDETGDAFDRLYARTEIEDHQKVIALYEKEAESGADMQLRAYAVKQLPALREHLEMARKLPGAPQQ
jgi:putative membrane protein